MAKLNDGDWKKYLAVVRNNPSSSQLYEMSSKLYKKGQTQLARRLHSEAVKRSTYTTCKAVLRKCGGNKAKAMDYIRQQMDNFGGM